MLIVGLAPAAHGANRTGRVFTGDRSGDWLFASLHRVGVAALPTSISAGDGQALTGVRVTAAVRCAPPGNAPTPDERDTCAPWLVREIALTSPRVLVALGGFAWQSALRALADLGEPLPSPRPKFGHGATARVGDRWLVGSYHPSQQNTFTGRLTEPMLDDVLGRAVSHADSVPPEGDRTLTGPGLSRASLPIGLRRRAQPRCPDRAPDRQSPTGPASPTLAGLSAAWGLLPAPNQLTWRGSGRGPAPRGG